MPKGVPNKRYTPEFKRMVVETMKKEHLSSLFGEKLYLSPILDLHSSDLVSYTISDRPVLSMVTTMLDEAFAKIPAGTNLILHSDQGWQYQHKQYQRMLRERYPAEHESKRKLSGQCCDRKFGSFLNYGVYSQF